MLLTEIALVVEHVNTNALRRL